jgi:hypothetical protein
MTVATAKAVAARFLTSDQPEVLALKGAWGVGKTYAWNKTVLECRDDIKLPNYCYVSLFGMSSISELRTAIFTKTQSVNRLGIRLDAEIINKEWLGIVGEQTKKLFRLGSGIIKELPYGKNITVGLETLAPYFIRNTIICLDDFERLATGTGSIKTEEILGLISELKEEKGCKVVLVFNEEKLNDKDIYSRYREKVVDIEVLYDPTPEEATEIALPRNLPCRALVKKNCISLGVKNIRVLLKTVGLIEMVNGVAGSLHPGVMEKAVHTLVLLAWCYFDSDDKKPTLDFLRHWNRIAWRLSEDKKAENPQHETWRNSLQKYGLISIEEFDLSIIKIIERGYLEESGFIEAAQALDERLRAQELEGSFRTAWRLFRESLSDNSESLINELETSFKRSARHIDPINLSSTTTLLRDLGRGDLADELIEFYLAAHATNPGIFDLEMNPFASDIKDPAIWECFKKRQAETKALMPMTDAVMYIADHSGWSNVHIEPLLAATEDDYFNLFKQDHGEQLSRIISSCLQFENFEEKLKTIGRMARAALTRIGNETPLNAIRVRRYGINIDPLTASPKSSSDAPSDAIEATETPKPQ